MRGNRDAECDDAELDTDALGTQDTSPEPGDEEDDNAQDH
jgi:hypothetical protein